VVLNDMTKWLENEKGLDGIAKMVGDAVGKVVPPGPIKDALSGTWLGHTLHPVLTDLPIGAWASATALDLIGGEESEEAARRLIGLGILATVPTAWSGLSDYSDTVGEERRVGLTHAAFNVAAFALFAASYGARGNGSSVKSKGLSLLGLGAATFGAYLGAHLSLDMGVGVDHTAYESGPGDWTPTVQESEVEEGKATKFEVDGVDIFLTRHGGRVCALSDRCTHAGGPLDEGIIQGGTVKCPWHGSVFSLEDGSVEQGPARAPQPAYETRVIDGRVEVRSTE
jgi:nitrite reductase/ring-hydroxylating ferredoxin subunit/uncharacterized membrane protein